MKRFRILWLSVAALMGLFFVSCSFNNAESSPFPWAWRGVVRVNSNGTFSDADGAKLTPSTPSFSNATIAFVSGNITGELPGGGYAITLLAEPLGIDAPLRLPDAPDAAEDVKANTAIVGLVVSNGTNPLMPAFFDAHTLVLPVSFFAKSGTGVTESTLHTFPLVGYKSEMTSGATELKLHLRHVVSGDVSIPRTSEVWLYQAYSLHTALRLFTQQTGIAKPSKIVVHYGENPQSDKLGENYSADKKIEIEYKY